MDDALFDYWHGRLDRDGYLDADLILRELFVHADTEGRPCPCGCHPTLGSVGIHEPDACPCAQTPEQRRKAMEDLFDEIAADREAWKASDEGRIELARRSAEKAELEAWIGAHDEVDVTAWGGCFPEQWWGSVDGHSFYFREKRGHWRIELDLRPTGRFFERVVLPDNREGSLERTERVEVEEGHVIAEGWASDLGVTPLHHGRFIVNTIRAHLRREGCTHPGARRYCPECGATMM